MKMERALFAKIAILSGIVLSFGCSLENIEPVGDKCPPDGQEGEILFMGGHWGDRLPQEEMGQYDLSTYCPVEYSLCYYDRDYKDDSGESVGAYGCLLECEKPGIYCKIGDSPQCINPNQDSTFCGARGTCSDSEKDSANWRGERCGNGMICLNGTCKCKNENYEICSDEEGSHCEDVRNNEKYCGSSCKECEPSERCNEGMCTADECQQYGISVCRSQSGKCKNFDDACGKSCTDCTHLDGVESAKCDEASGQCIINSCQKGHHLVKSGEETLCVTNDEFHCALPNQYDEKNCHVEYPGKAVKCNESGICESISEVVDPPIVPPDPPDPPVDECVYPLQKCGGVCSDIQSNVSNCGECYHDCNAYLKNPSTGYYECSSGTCLLVCKPGYVYNELGDDCVLPTTTPPSDGTCPPNQLRCGGQCVGPVIKGSPRVKHFLPVRYKPEKEDPNGYYQIELGYPVQIYGSASENPKWYRVDPDQGYAHSDNIWLCMGYATVTTVEDDHINLWSKIGSGRTSKKKIPTGTNYLCLQGIESNGWYKAAYEMETGYVNGEYLIIDGGLGNNPSLPRCD